MSVHAIVRDDELSAVVGIAILRRTRRDVETL